MLKISRVVMIDSFTGKMVFIEWGFVGCSSNCVPKIFCVVRTQMGGYFTDYLGFVFDF